MLTLEELHHDSCRWPVAEVRGVHLFCGETAVSAKPYCERHLRLAYRTREDMAWLRLPPDGVDPQIDVRVAA